MEKKVPFVQIIFFLLLSFVIVFIQACRDKQVQDYLQADYSLSTEELNSLQSGDIIFRMGYGPLSASIVSMLNDTVKLSHCGIIARDSSGLSVIHTLSSGVSNTDGMQQCSIDEFISESRLNSIVVVRFKKGSGERIAAKATYYLEKQLPFDIYFNLLDSSALFCSELPIRILNDEFRFDILQEKEPTIYNCKFSLFFNPQYFEQIIYHLNR